MGNQPFCITLAAIGGNVQLEIPQTFRGKIILSKPHAVLDLSPGICEHLFVSKEEHWADEHTTELAITNKADHADGAHAALPFKVALPR